MSPPLPEACAGHRCYRRFWSCGLFLSWFGLVVYLQVQASVVVSFCLRFWVVARPFLGPARQGLTFFFFLFLVFSLLSWGLGILCAPSLWMFRVLCSRTPGRLLLSSFMVNTMKILGLPLFKFFLGGSLELLSGMPQPSKTCCDMIRFLWVVALVKFLRSGVLSRCRCTIILLRRLTVMLRRR